MNAEHILRAIHAAIRSLGPAARRVDAIALSVMSPAWIAMDSRGRAITPIITHQDRRSVEVALDLEKRIGKTRHLKLVGNRPVPGGISSTTWAWFNRHEKSLMHRADLVGHLNTFILRQLTGARLVDPSNASFMGLFRIDQSGWCDEICAAVGASEHQLPQIVSGDAVGGMVTHPAARRLRSDPWHARARRAYRHRQRHAPGRHQARPITQRLWFHRRARTLRPAPRPHEQLITRALGVDRKWLSVSTLAAGGSTFRWLREQFFSDLSDARFDALLARLAHGPAKSSVRFEPYLAGDRMSLQQRQAAITGLSLSTTREQILSAAIESIAAAGAVASICSKPSTAASAAASSSPAASSKGFTTSFTAIGEEHGISASRKRHRSQTRDVTILNQ